MFYITEKPFWIKVADYSNWFKLLRVVVYVLQFLKTKIWIKLSDALKGKYLVIFLIFKHIKEDSFVSAKEQQGAEYLPRDWDSNTYSISNSGR